MLFMWLLTPWLLHSQSQEPEHLKLARTYVGVTETAKNSSPEIDSFLRYVGLNPGNPYCAAFVSTMIGRAGAVEPKVRSGLASNFITKKSIPASKVLIGMETVPPGTIIVWRKGNTIFGHTGFVIHWNKASGETIEANTSAGIRGNQRDGEGIYIRRRTIVPGDAFRITHFTLVTYE